MQKQSPSPYRTIEAAAIILIAAIAFLGFLSAAAALQIRQGENPVTALPSALLPPLAAAVSMFALHLFLQSRKMRSEQILVPVTSLLFVTGLLMIWRLRGPEAAWQQILRGLVPGLVIAALLIAKPQRLELLRRYGILAGIAGIIIPFATALFGVVDETGARLALKLGPLPSIQTTELIKLSLIIFLAWYIERQGQAAEGRARPLFGWLRLPALQNLVPGVLFVVLATLALVAMSDYGAVLILGSIFIGMLYAGFQTRTFFTVAGLGLVMALIAGLILALTWEVPAVIRYRFIAFLNPWSTEVLTLNGLPTGITVSEGPGYQIQQAIYAVMSGGLTGTGIGFGSPDYVPLAHSDFILAAIIEELGAVTGIALLFLFAVLLLRIMRTTILLPSGQVFEKLLLVGISVHLFTQVFVMAGGTLNLLPVTGVTIPFVSLGGMALLVNLVEVGIVLAVSRRMEGLPK